MEEKPMCDKPEEKNSLLGVPEQKENPSLIDDEKLLHEMRIHSMDTHIITEKNIFHLALLLNVPGEAIVNRLYEINEITGNMRKKVLSIPDEPEPNTLV
jgi:hypothetical protein